MLKKCVGGCVGELELSQILKDTYRNALDGDSVAMIHLFGIHFF